MRKALSTAMLCILGLVFLESNAWSVEIAGYESKSESPMQFKVRLGACENSSEMLIVLDQSTGGGSYDTAICDDNLDDSLADEEVVAGEMGKHESIYFTFETVAPFGKIDPKAKYEINLHVHEPQNNRTPVGLSTFVTVKTGEGDWMYSVLHGHPTGRPSSDNIYRLSVGKPIKVDIRTRPRGAMNVDIGSFINDEDGQLVRAYRVLDNKLIDIVPCLKVDSPTGRTLIDKDLSYG